MQLTDEKRAQAITLLARFARKGAIHETDMDAVEVVIVDPCAGWETLRDLISYFDGHPLMSRPGRTFFLTAFGQAVCRQLGIDKVPAPDVELSTLSEKAFEWLAEGRLSHLMSEARNIGITVLAAKTALPCMASLNETADTLCDRLASGVVFLTGRDDDTLHMVARVTEDLADEIEAGAVLRAAVNEVGGRIISGAPERARGTSGHPDEADEADDAVGAVLRFVDEHMRGPAIDDLLRQIYCAGTVADDGFTISEQGLLASTNRVTWRDGIHMLTDAGYKYCHDKLLADGERPRHATATTATVVEVSVRGSHTVILDVDDVDDDQITLATNQATKIAPYLNCAVGIRAYTRRTAGGYIVGGELLDFQPLRTPEEVQAWRGWCAANASEWSA